MGDLNHKAETFILHLFSRYIFLVILGLGNLFIIYKIFTFPTIFSSYNLLKIFFEVSLSGNFIFFKSQSIEIINACIAGSAYYLLLILNLSTEISPLKSRIYSLIFSLFVLFIFNVLRIVLLSYLFFNDYSSFDIIHKATWYGLSALIVVSIWFAEVYIFKIKNIPIYSDIKKLLKLTKKKN